MTTLRLLVGVSAATLALGIATTAFAASRHHPVHPPIVVAPVVEAPATPSIADGYISLAIGSATITPDDNSGDDESVGGLSLTGRATGAYQFSSVLGFQGDIVLASQKLTPNGAPSEYSVNDRSLDVALHGYYREEGSFLLGGFVQYGTDNFVEDAVPYGESFDRYYGGIEGQSYLGDLTLYGQIGVQQLTIAGFRTNGYFGTFEARYYLQPNFKLDAHIGFNNLTDFGFDSEDGDLNTWNAGVGAEYRLDATPFSLFAKYDYVHYSFGGGSGDAHDNRFLVGAKFNFGTDTLEQRDHSGATLNPVEAPTLPFFGLGSPG